MKVCNQWKYGHKKSTLILPGNVYFSVIILPKKITPQHPSCNWFLPRSWSRNLLFYQWNIQRFLGGFFCPNSKNYKHCQQTTQTEWLSLWFSHCEIRAESSETPIRRRHPLVANENHTSPPSMLPPATYTRATICSLLCLGHGGSYKQEEGSGCELADCGCASSFLLLRH